MADGIQGAGGKGGGSAFSEQDSSLRTNTVVSALELVSRGPIRGLVEGAKSVFLDDTPLQNSDGTLNFKGVSVQVLNGLPDQEALRGFEDVQNPISVNTAITGTTPVVRTVSSPDIDQVQVSISFPQGLFQQDTKNNAIIGASVAFEIQTKLSSSGTWVTVQSPVIEGKTGGAPFARDFIVPRPTGSGVWDIRVRRLTPDASSSLVRDASQWSTLVEIQKETVTYPNIAALAISLDAAGTNMSSEPVRSAEMYLRIIRVPTNFDPISRTYSGVWNGLFKNEWSDDSAWVLYDMISLWLDSLGYDDTFIDKYAFYEASVYCSQKLTFVDALGNTHVTPRFSFNYQITEAEQSWDFIQKIAGAMNARVAWVGNKVSVIQDRPRVLSTAIQVTNANVIDGNFKRSSTEISTRKTVANVTWNAPADGYKTRVTHVQGSQELLDRYGFQEANIAAVGCTNLPQAVRYGRHYIETSANTPGIITFQIGRDGESMVPNTLLKISDEFFVGASFGGRLKSGSTASTLKLDRMIQIPSGSTIQVRNTNGVTEEKGITGSGLVDTVVLASSLASPPGEFSTYIVSTPSTSPEYYVVTSRKEIERGVYEISGAQYDHQKYARVDGTVTALVPSYIALRQTTVSAPKGLTLTETSSIVDLSPTRVLRVSWEAPAPTETVTSWRVTYSFDGASTTKDTFQPFLEVPVQPGVFEVFVQALSYAGVLSKASYLKHNIQGSEEIPGELDAPVNLQVKGGGTTFITPSLEVSFQNPISNQGKKQVLAAFKVQVLSAGSVLRTTYVDGVLPGQTAYYTYSFDDNLADGGPRRSLTIKVQGMDPAMRVTSEVSGTFTNPVPGAVSLSVAAGVKSAKVQFSLPSDLDLKGVLIWRSTTSGFAPSAETLVADILANSYTDIGLAADQTYYYRAAAYDAFGKDSNGTGLNVSVQAGVTPVGLNVEDIRGNINENLLDAETRARLALTESADQLAKTAVRDIDRLADAVTQLSIKTHKVDSTLSGAGIAVDPNTGTVKISAFEHTNQKLNDLSISLDAANASITSKASVAYVDGQIAAAVMGGQQAVFDSLDLRLTEAENEIDGLNAAVTSKASLTQVANAEARITTAESSISALNAQITNKVESTEFNTLESRVTTAENTISAIDGAAQDVTVLTAGQFKLDQDLARAGESTLAGVLAAWQNNQQVEQALAYAREDLTAKINEDISAEASRRLELAVRVDEAFSAIESLELVYSDGEQALAQQLTTLQAEVDAAQAAITQEATARATADTASSTLITGLNTRMGAAEGAITQVQSSVTALDQSVTSSLSALEARVEDTEADIVTEQTARANADSALSTQIATLTANVANNTAAITAEQTARANADSAISNTVSSLTATVGTKNKSYRQTPAPTSGMTAGDIWFDSDDGNKAYRYSGTAWIATDDTRIAANQAAITAEQTARANADSALANSISTLTATVGNNHTTVTTTTSAHANRLGVLEGQYTVKIDANGQVSGFGLATTAANAAPSSTFTVNANAFKISSPTISGSTPVTPFKVYTTPTVENGVTVQPGVYMDAAMIGSLRAGSITTDHLVVGSVSNTAGSTITSAIISPSGAAISNRSGVLETTDTFNSTGKPILVAFCGSLSYFVANTALGRYDCTAVLRLVNTSTGQTYGTVGVTQGFNKLMQGVSGFNENMTLIGVITGVPAGTYKMRVSFDAAAATSTGSSWNNLTQLNAAGHFTFQELKV